MDSHPSHPILSGLLAKYPRASSSLFQTYNDIVYAQQWKGVEVVDLECCSRGAIKGRKRDSEDINYVVPCSLSETLSFNWLEDAFSRLLPQDVQDGSSLPFLYLAITSSDSSIVYYKLSRGMIKPPM